VLRRLFTQLRRGWAFSETQAVGSTHFPRDSQSYDALKVRFSATVGEELEVKVALV
jgi:hypothetical protein